MIDKIELTTFNGYYRIDPYQLDKAIREFSGVSLSRMTEILTAHTGCDYSDVDTMSELLIIAADTGLV